MNPEKQSTTSTSNENRSNPSKHGSQKNQTPDKKQGSPELDKTKQNANAHNQKQNKHDQFSNNTPKDIDKDRHPEEQVLTQNDFKKR